MYTVEELASSSRCSEDDVRHMLLAYLLPRGLITNRIIHNTLYFFPTNKLMERWRHYGYT